LKKAIITLATNHYNELWETHCKNNWKIWADLNNYELHCFTKILDGSIRSKGRSHAWQKLLAMTQEKFNKYDYCLWLDADIFINPKAPDPVTFVDRNLIAVTIETGSPYSDELINIKRSWNEAYRKQNHGRSWEERNYFNGWGFKGTSRPLFNTGVIGYSPRAHSEFLKDIYYRWEESEDQSLWGEMIPFNLAVQASDWQMLPKEYNRLAFPISKTWHKFIEKDKASWNASLSKVCMTEDQFIMQIYNESYFLHLAGASKDRFINYSKIINGKYKNDQSKSNLIKFNTTTGY